MKCKKHPKYQGKSVPRVVCDQCVDVYLAAYNKKKKAKR